MRRGRWAWAVISASLLLAVGVRVAALSHQAAPNARPPDVLRVGPQVGERVPDFTLTDQHGQTRTLSSLFGRNGLMLVFYRSADW